MIHTFILTYRGGEYLPYWFGPNNFNANAKFYLVDNGQQLLAPELEKLLIHRTEQNIGCAGGWNLECQIAFNHLGLDKVILSSDDSIFDQPMLEQMWDAITPNALVGMYGRGFGFACFGIHRDLFNSVGLFDENFTFGTCEDSDYQRRMELLGKDYIQLMHDADMNCSISYQLAKDWYVDMRGKNTDHFNVKWGANSEYPYPFNDPNFGIHHTRIHPRLKEVYGDITEFPSYGEYRRYLEKAK